MRRVLGVLLFLISLTTEAAVYALVLQDETPLRPTPGASAKPSTVLWQGEMVEIRAHRGPVGPDRVGRDVARREGA